MLKTEGFVAVSVMLFFYVGGYGCAAERSMGNGVRESSAAVSGSSPVTLPVSEYPAEYTQNTREAEPAVKPVKKKLKLVSLPSGIGGSSGRVSVGGGMGGGAMPGGGAGGGKGSGSGGGAMMGGGGAGCKSCASGSGAAGRGGGMADGGMGSGGGNSGASGSRGGGGAGGGSMQRGNTSSFGQGNSGGMSGQARADNGRQMRDDAGTVRIYDSPKAYKNRKIAKEAKSLVVGEMSDIDGMEIVSSTVTGRGIYGFRIRYRYEAAVGVYLSRSVFDDVEAAENGMRSQLSLLAKPGRKTLSKAARCLSNGRCLYIIIYPA